ncbi:MAG TPA: AzlC family ABC transporter permease [Desulfovibrio sp.]|jgi:4-azaleucine resistance transporter AzlC|uniref:AzlC family ABC transporter permease n=1 Tax=Desulfovibrio TaxID=872 RepID=UPI000405F53C|nr:MULTISPECIES: AzlC family ABC transporter permease [Desulfovibrio]MDY0305233.1 AzlC family ABC transporter permease [Desulfovibrionaceae bacterium]HMM37450.1 AzlC family ABC transporter permease [Desulfovibrio sp.]
MDDARALPAPGSWPEILSGARQALPIVLGYLPVGFAFGVLALKAGMTPLAAALTSVFVFAGSAQLIATSLLAAGAPALTIVLTTFVVNLRHVLMSAALSPHLRDWSRPGVAWFCAQLTDETFALHASRFAQGRTSKAETLAINATAHSAWITGSILGAFCGGLIGDVKPLGLDFALSAMFLALLAGQVGTRPRQATAVAAAGFSTLFLSLGFGHWGVIAACVLAATLGCGVETWTRK